MKTSAIGMVSAAILLVAACVGLGIAQAEGTHSDSPVLSFQDQEAIGQGTSPIPYVADLVETGNLAEPGSADGIQLSSESQEFVPEGNWSGTDWQVRGPVATGNLPEMGNADSPIVETEGDMYRAGEDSGGP